MSSNKCNQRHTQNVGRARIPQNSIFCLDSFFTTGGRLGVWLRFGIFTRLILGAGRSIRSFFATHRPAVVAWVTLFVGSVGAWIGAKYGSFHIYLLTWRIDTELELLGTRAAAWISVAAGRPASGAKVQMLVPNMLPPPGMTGPGPNSIGRSVMLKFEMLKSDGMSKAVKHGSSELHDCPDGSIVQHRGRPGSRGPPPPPRVVLKPPSVPVVFSAWAREQERKAAAIWRRMSNKIKRLERLLFDVIALLGEWQATVFVCVSQ
ncbi:hypothetical protein ACHAWT_001951 [Skeletonema menzelii]